MKCVTSNVFLYICFLLTKIRRFVSLSKSSGKWRGSDHLVLRSGSKKYHKSPDISANRATSWEVSVTWSDLPKRITFPFIFITREIFLPETKKKLVQLPQTLPQEENITLKKMNNNWYLETSHTNCRQLFCHAKCRSLMNSFFNIISDKSLFGVKQTLPPKEVKGYTQLLRFVICKMLRLNEQLL